jgi:hypothetical protein
MGFLSSLTSALVKTAITPIAIAKDVLDVATGNEANNTKKHIEDIGNDIEDGLGFNS